jgi:hypothetical protein
MEVERQQLSLDRPRPSVLSPQRPHYVHLAGPIGFTIVYYFSSMKMLLEFKEKNTRIFSIYLLTN